MTALAEAALDLARRGWAVFPSRPGSKLPLVAEWPDVATTDVDQVAAWWRRWPHANISHVPGASGTTVLDLDGPEGFTSWRRLQRAHGAAPVTRVVRSPREAGGVHLYWRAPEGVYVKSVASRIGSTDVEGIDVRGTRGQAILPPSVKADGAAYQWVNPEVPLAPMPAWLAAMFLPRPRPVFRRPAPVGDPSSRLDGLVRTVLDCGPKDLNTRLHWAACRAGEMVQAGQGDPDGLALALHEAAVDRGHPPSGAWATIRSGMGKYDAVPTGGGA